MLEFNLSQFSGPEEIIDALHRVRDVVLSGKIPLVFWDEFDSRLKDQDLGWLRFFLSPCRTVPSVRADRSSNWTLNIRLCRWYESPN